MKCTFVEAPMFSKRLKEFGKKTLLKRVQDEILKYPDNGVAVQGTGGVKKIRVKGYGQGKSSSYRVFYLELCEGAIIHLIFILTKNDSENISDEEKKVIKKLVEKLKKKPCP